MYQMHHSVIGTLGTPVHGTRTGGSVHFRDESGKKNARFLRCKPSGTGKQYIIPTRCNGSHKSQIFYRYRKRSKWDHHLLRFWIFNCLTMIVRSTRGQQTYFWSTENAIFRLSILQANRAIMHFPTLCYIWQQALVNWPSKDQTRIYCKKQNPPNRSTSGSASPKNWLRR